MDKFIGNRMIYLITGLFIFSIMAGNLFAQDVKNLEKRIAALENRVKKLEMALDMALNPSKHSQKVKKEMPAKTQARKKVSISSPIRTKLIKKNLKLAEPGEVDDNLAFLITFHNDGPVGIVAYKGEIVFKDMYGDSIMSFEADISKAISSNMSNTWFGGVVYDAGNASHRKILNMDIKNILIDFKPEKIVYSDGTVKTSK